MPQKTLRVKSRFEASENISATARKIEKNTRRLNRNMKRGFRESSQSALKFKGVLKSILAASVIQKGFGLLSRGISEVTGQFVSFDDSITAAGAKFSLSGKEALSFEQIMKNIKASARAAGNETIFTATQAARALEFLARAGFTSVEAMGSLNSMINLSIATGEEFARAADISSDLLGSFGLASENSAQKIKNLNRLNNLLVATANSANVNLENMFDTMKDVGPIATEVLGVGLEKVFAITGALGDAGLKGTKGMTAIKGIMVSLGAPTSKGGQTLKALGVAMFDIATGKPRDIITVMKELRTSLNQLPDGARVKAIKDIFGRIPLAGAALFLRDIEKIRGVEERLKKTGNISQETADIMQTSLGNRIKGLGSALTELGFKVLDPFEKKIKGSIVALTEFFRGQDAKPLIETINLLGQAFEKFGGIVKIQLEPFREFLAVLEPLGKELKPIAEFLFKSAEKLDELLPEAKDKKTTTVGLLLAGPQAAIELQTELIKKLKTPEERSNFLSSLLKEIFFTKRDFLTVGGKTLAELDKEKGAVETVKTLFKGTPEPKNTRPEVQGVIETPKPLKPQFEASRKPLKPEVEVPNINPNLNVKVENNIKGNDVEVETTVDAPKTSGGQGVNKI